MVKLTIELVRKKAEHHNGELAPLKEISLHQEAIEKIENIQQWCPKLEILLLQSNLIGKIENVNKLKRLEYLNLAINNIEKIENLEKCESLQKLDLTLNFIGELTSVENLKNNYNLQKMYLTGNPCADYQGYRDYIIVSLPQLEELDGLEIKKSNRIIALQNFNSILERIYEQQKLYAKKREIQKFKLEKEIKEKWSENKNIDDKELKEFWNKKCEHSPEIRIEIERQSRRQKKENKETIENKKERVLFAPNGRPYNINEPKFTFQFDDNNLDYFLIELHIYKYLDSSLINLDVQPNYIRIINKEKLFQLCLPEEINIEKSSARRSQITGHLVITLIKMNSDFTSEKIYNTNVNKKIKNDKTFNIINKQMENQSMREYLEIGPVRDVLDFTKIININKNKNISFKKIFIPKEKLPSESFEDDLSVPPLI